MAGASFVQGNLQFGLGVRVGLGEEGLAVQAQLVGRNGRAVSDAVQPAAAVINGHADRCGLGGGIERGNAGVLAGFELGFEQLGVVGAEHNQRAVALAAHHFTQAAAGALQHHVAGAVAFLRQDDTGEAVAVPAFFANLYQQHHAKA